MFSLSACSDTDTSTTTSDTALVSTTPATITTTTTTHIISENENYTDLKTGKTFKVKKDAATGNWVRENNEPLEYYLSPVTHDTFYGPTGRWVNNALIYDPGSGYSIDEVRWQQMNADNGTMEPGKVKMTEEELKAKTSDGADKVKITNDETKIKTSEGTKIKSNENETKIKQK